MFSKKSKNELVSLTRFPPSNTNKERISVACKVRITHKLFDSCHKTFQIIFSIYRNPLTGGYLNGNDGRLKSHQLICSCNQHFCDWNWFQGIWKFLNDLLNLREWILGQPKKCLDPTCEPVKYIKWGKYVQVRIAGKNGVHLETRFLHKQSSWKFQTRKLLRLTIWKIY